MHFDPVNLVCSPRRLYDTGSMIREFCEKLGPWIKSIHAKDVSCDERLTFHVDERRPGQGVLDYAALLRGAERLNPDMPVLLEHLPNEEEYRLAAVHRAQPGRCVRSEAQMSDCSIVFSASERAELLPCESPPDDARR